MLVCPNSDARVSELGQHQASAGVPSVSSIATGPLSPSPSDPSSAAALLTRSVFQFLGFLAGRDSHHLDGIADHVGGALLASGASWHAYSVRCSPLSMCGRCRVDPS